MDAGRRQRSLQRHSYVASQKASHNLAGSNERCDLLLPQTTLRITASPLTILPDTSCDGTASVPCVSLGCDASGLSTCVWREGEAACGAGAEVGLSSTSEDGLGSANIRLVMDRVGNSNRSSFALNFDRRF